MISCAAWRKGGGSGGAGRWAHAAALNAELAAPATTAARAAEITRLIWNDRVDAVMTALFVVIVAVILLDSIRVWVKLALSAPPRQSRTQEAAA